MGIERLVAREESLVAEALTRLNALPGVEVYGETDVERAARVGVVSFNIRGLDHGLVAAALSDYHNVAVRHGCFCAHPYVRELLTPMLWNLDVDGLSNAEAEVYLAKKRGMVRSSFGLYSTPEDLEALLRGVGDLTRNAEEFRAKYVAQPDATYKHMGEASATPVFHPGDVVAAALASRKASARTSAAGGPRALTFWPRGAIP